MIKRKLDVYNRFSILARSKVATKQISFNFNVIEMKVNENASKSKKSEFRITRKQT